MKVLLAFFLICRAAALFDYTVPPYSTKTGYYLSFNQEEKDLLEGTSSYVPDVCTPLHISATIRHGTRYPGADDIPLLRGLADRIRGKVFNPQFAALNDTYVTFPEEEGDELSESGRQEMQDIGARYAKRFEGLLLDALPEEYIYYSSYRSRTIESAENFQYGLSDVFGKNMSQEIMDRSDIIRFYELCPHYIESVEENPDALLEYELFQTGPELSAIPTIITNKLHMSPDITFNLEEIKMLWELAGYQSAIEEFSPWADLFTWEEKDLIQYSDDIDNYLTKGYQYAISYEMSCPLLTDMFYHMDQSLMAHSQRLKSWTKGALRFGHSQTIQPLQTLLGLYKDDVPLRHDNYDYQQLNRQFRGDRRAPMATSVGMEMYACDTDRPWSNTPPPGVEWPQQLSLYMVQLKVKEIPEKFPFCTTHLCDYDTVRGYYENFINCPFEEMCRINKS